MEDGDGGLMPGFIQRNGALRFALAVAAGWYGVPRLSAIASELIGRVLAETCGIDVDPAVRDDDDLPDVFVEREKGAERGEGGGGGTGGGVPVVRRPAGPQLACSAVPFLSGAARVVVQAAAYLVLANWAAPVLDAAGLLRGLGVSGAVVAYALRDVLQNLWAGVLLAVNGPFHIGDRVVVRSQMMNHEGVVEGMTMRHILIRQEDDVLIHMPNSTALAAIVRILPPKRPDEKSGAAV